MQENVERVRHAHEVFNRLEPGSAIHLATTEWFHPEIEWHDQRELPGATVHQGIEAVERHLSAAQAAVDYYDTDLLEVLDAGPSVIAVYRFHARGQLSGAPVERVAAWVYGFRGTKIDRVQIFGSRSEALAAVGLSE